MMIVLKCFKFNFTGAVLQVSMECAVIIDIKTSQQRLNTNPNPLDLCVHGLVPGAVDRRFNENLTFHLLCSKPVFRIAMHETFSISDL